MASKNSQLGLVVALVLMASAGVLGQQISGTITGNVADTSGAVLPGAEVAAKNTATGVDSVAVVNDQGLYRVPNLPPGIYDLTASLPGFKTTVISGIEVRVDSVVRRDVALDVGAIAEQVTVQASRNVVESEEPSLGEVVGETEILELPSGEKNFMTLASITAGVTPELPTGEFGSSYANRSNLQVAISGQRHVSTNVLFDGIPSKEFYIGLVATIPAVETLREFKVQKGYFAGNYDNAAVINVVTKSGTNEIHGTLWEAHQNDNTNARNFFDVGSPEILRNQYGFEVGGPILSDKLFWYGSYEGIRGRESGTGRGSVPHAGWLNGDFSDLLPDTQLVDPMTGNPFNNNQVPSSRIDGFAQTWMERGFIPGPTHPGAALNYIGPTLTVVDENKVLVRFDYAASENDKFFGRYSYSRSDRLEDRIIREDSTRPLHADNMVIDWVHVFGPALTLNLKGGLNRVDFSAAGRSQDTETDWGQVFGVKNINTVPVCNRVLSLGIGGVGGFGTWSNNCEEPVQKDQHYLVNVNWIEGKHQVMLGAEVRRKRQDLAIVSGHAGRFTFNNNFSGHNFADFLLGHPSSIDGVNYQSPVKKHAIWYNGFIQDDIKLAQNFTLSLGMRYQVYPWETDEDHLIMLFIQEGDGSTIQATPDKPRLVDIDGNDFAPRIGFAWTPGGRDDLAIRSSFGVFYDDVPGNDRGWDSIGPSVGVGQNYISDLLSPTLSTTGQLPDPPAIEPTSIMGPNVFFIMNSETQRRDPYQQVWTLSMQKTWGSDLFTEIAYVGSHGIHMSKRRNINVLRNPQQPECGSACRITKRPFKNYAWILTDQGEGQAYYHGLETSLRKRLSGGLSFTAAYTYSKSLDWDSFDNKGSRAYVPGKPDKGRSTFDVRQRFVTSFIYETPRMQDMSTFTRNLFGGWQLSGIGSLQSGFGFHPTTSFDPSNTEQIATNKRPDRTCDGNGGRAINQWFGAKCFQMPALGTFGNSGVHFLDTDGYINFDFSVAKNFYVPQFNERAKFQLRFDSFNFFNNVNFGKPGSRLERASFGVVSSALPGRIFQFGLRFSF